MCGIVGILGQGPVADRLLDGLKRLEYRGYDSAGICTIDGGGLERRRAEGKLDNLAAELRREHTTLTSPDAIILASAQANGWTLITRNIKDAPAEMPGIRLPYTL